MHVSSARVPVLAATVAAMAVFLTASPASAATITVAAGAMGQNTNGTCSLIEAIGNASGF